MKIVYIGTHNNPILDALLSTEEVIGIAESVNSHQSTLINRVAFSLNDFNRLIKGEGYLQLSRVARKKKIPFFAFTKEEQSDFAQWIKKLNPELLVIYSMGHLLSKEIVDLPNLTIINYHPSLLPQYRGPNPDFWIYYYMDLNPGGTVHLVDHGEDTGAILFAEGFTLSLGERYSSYKRKSMALGAKLIKKAIKSLKTGSAEKYMQIGSSDFSKGT
ncbi:formyltransferase family protein [Solitalea koreensis]|uniref:Formyl transferase n=1 Tax=Solitalea koreensis TaxID=543615 RepID=A0A521ARY6_9SPHI|nr:formyltransferase family protein [Solitalea koreensis]SMO37603.1 Formyl transferase [Solitalea koreensis]